MPYTYSIKWSKYNKWYYGVRYSKYSHPKELWETYFTSSIYVQQMRKKYGEPDVIRVRKIFETDNYEVDKNNALQWETKFLKKTNAAENCNSLNRWNNNMVPHRHIDGEYPFQQPEIQQKVSKTFKEKYGGKASKSNIIKQKVFNTNRRRYGTHHTLHLNNVVMARKQRNIELYGVENPFYSKEFQNSLSNPMHDPKIRKKHKKIMEQKNWNERNEKTKQTNLERYGVTNPLNTPENIKMKQEKAKLYGVQCPFCLDDIKWKKKSFQKHMSNIHQWIYSKSAEYYNDIIKKN